MFHGMPVAEPVVRCQREFGSGKWFGCVCVWGGGAKIHFMADFN